MHLFSYELWHSYISFSKDNNQSYGFFSFSISHKLIVTRPFCGLKGEVNNNRPIDSILFKKFITTPT